MGGDIILLEKRCKNLIRNMEADKNHFPEIKAAMEELLKLLHAANDYRDFEVSYRTYGRAAGRNLIG